MRAILETIVEMLLKVIGTLKLQEKEPERDPPPALVSVKYVKPDIRFVDVPMKNRGKYKTKSGQAKGVVVHYTAGRQDQGSAMGTLIDGAASGYSYFCMDIDGVIHVPNSIGFSGFGYHAGTSKWNGVSGVSQYLYGMEICSAGKLVELDKKLYPYYCFKNWSGKKADLLPGAKHISQDKCRLVKAKDNIKQGWYLKYTDKQELALKNFCLWQLDTNKEFSIDWVVGHDEVAPDRKSDPGGSLSTSMPEFRSMLRKSV